MSSLNSGKGLDLALLVAGCQEQTSGGPGLTRRQLRAFQLLHPEREETGEHLRYLRAKHPAIPSGGVHHVQAVSSRVTLSPPSRRQAARSPASTTRFTTVPDAQKALSLTGKGLDLRKLVAGAGFEPATSGL